MGLNLKIARIKKGLTQDELCEMVGIGRTTLSQLEQGKANPKLTLMKKLSKALEVSPVELFFSEE